MGMEFLSGRMKKFWKSSVFRKYLKHIYSEITAHHVLYECKFGQIPFTVSSFAYKTSNVSLNLLHFCSANTMITNFKWGEGERKKRNPRDSLTSECSKYVTG